MASQRVYFECPHCGEDVLAGAKVCRACGASDESGWNEDDFGDNYDDEYKDAIYNAPSGSTTDRATAVRFWVRLVILVIIVSFILSLGLL